MYVAKRINIQRFHWLSHDVRMDEDASPTLVFDAVVGDNRGRPHLLWENPVERTLTLLGAINWKADASGELIGSL